MCYKFNEFAKDWCRRTCRQCLSEYQNPAFFLFSFLCIKYHDLNIFVVLLTPE